MLWCPKCGTEYRDGFTECADCHVALTDVKPPVQAKPYTNAGNLRLLTDPVAVYETADPESALMICEMLCNAEIDAVLMENEQGGPLKAYTGVGGAGAKIYVSQAQFQEAHEFLQIWAEQDTHAPISEEELSRVALQALPEDALAAQAETAPRRPMEENSACLGMRAALVAAALALGALLLFLAVTQ